MSLCIILGFFYLALYPRYMKRISHLDRSKKDYSEEIQESFIHMNQMEHHFFMQLHPGFMLKNGLKVLRKTSYDRGSMGG